MRAPQAACDNSQMMDLGGLLAEGVERSGLVPDAAARERLIGGAWGDHLVNRLTVFAREGVPAEPPEPRLPAECTPPLIDSYAPLAGWLEAWSRGAATAEPEALAGALREAGLAGLLLLLGQRLTPASLSDLRAIPPSHDQLLAAASAPHSDRDPLSVAARALAKHAARHPDRWWGEIRGDTAAKNANASAAVARILSAPTWWNVFGHHAHETVFEARCPSGHGARWANHGRRFIGFLEPFSTPR